MSRHEASCGCLAELADELAGLDDDAENYSCKACGHADEACECWQ